MLQRTLTVVALLPLAACAGRSNQPDVDLVQDPRCAAVADTIAKYVSEDALPAARLVGDESLRPPPHVSSGDSVEVDFVVWPSGHADTSSVQVVGVSDPQFVRDAVRFAAENRFTPAQVSGCNVVSRYSVVMRSGGPTRR
jgi:hypothetical protein